MVGSSWRPRRILSRNCWGDAWEEAEEDEILSQLPQRLRDFFRDLKIHPATVRDVMLRGGVEE